MITTIIMIIIIIIIIIIIMKFLSALCKNKTKSNQY